MKILKMALILILGIALFAFSCRKKGRRVMVRRTTSQYKRLKAARSDAERWNIVSRDYENAIRIAKLQPDSVEHHVKEALLMIGGGSYVWLKVYPGIVKELQMTTSDLVVLAESLEDKRHIDMPHVYSEYTRGEIAQKWLEILLGKTFERKATFRKWFDENHDYLVWNQSMGKFEMKDSTSNPVLD